MDDGSLGGSAIALVAQLRAAIADVRSACAPSTPGSCELHGLSLPCAARLGLYAVPPAARGLSPEVWADAANTLRTAATQLRGTLEAARDDASQHKSMVATARELATQASELTQATAGVDAAARGAQATRAAPAPLPELLWAGALADVATQPGADHARSLATLDALCAALALAARALQLECFQERVEMPEACAVEKTHTLTYAGRIMVVDVELGLTQVSDDQTYAPHVTLHVSYASAGSTEPKHADKQLADMLRRRLQQLADVLWGRGTPADGGAATLYEYAVDAWGTLMESLAALACIDALDAYAPDGAPVDLFAELERVGRVAEQVSEAEQQWCETPELMRQGHGVVELHKDVPFLRITFAPAHTASVLMAACAIPAHDSAPTLRRALPEVLDAAAAVPLTAHCRAVHGTGLERPLSYVARIDPPLVVPRRVARDVWRACGLAETAEKQAATHGTGYLAALRPAASRFTAALGDDASRTISALPFRSLAQLYGALEMLEEHARWATLIASADDSASAPVALALEADSAPGSSRLRLSWPAAGRILNVVVRAVAEDGWDVAAQAAPLDGQAPVELAVPHLADDATLAVITARVEQANLSG